ncbi:hypothetical protein WA158_008126 [Blastocystis sp. Blastoise]
MFTALSLSKAALRGSLMRRIATYSTVSSGEKYTLDYKLYCTKKENNEVKKISYWHDIDLFEKEPTKNDCGVVRFICEIPRGESGKFEISKEDNLNPIHQDEKKGKPRYYAAPSMIHYGALPQTWESPLVNELTDIGSFKGDDDPLDVLDFSYLPALTGDVYNIRVFGALALVDQEEMDWKLLGVNVKDPKCSQLRDYLDFFEAYHNELTNMRQWLINYKIPDGKAANSLAYQGMPIFEREALERVILPTHEIYLKHRKNYPNKS